MGSIHAEIVYVMFKGRLPYRGYISRDNHLLYDISDGMLHNVSTQTMLRLMAAEDIVY